MTSIELDASALTSSVAAFTGRLGCMSRAEALPVDLFKTDAFIAMALAMIHWKRDNATLIDIRLVLPQFLKNMLPPFSAQTSAKSRVKPAENADLEPTGLPFGLPETPLGQGFKLLCVCIVSHCCLVFLTVVWLSRRGVNG